MADNMTQNDKKFRNVEEQIIRNSELIFYSSMNLRNKIHIPQKTVFT